MVGTPPTTQYIHTHTGAHGQELEAFESIQTIGHGGELAPLLSPTIPTDRLSAWIHMSLCPCVCQWLGHPANWLNHT